MPTSPVAVDAAVADRHQHARRRDREPREAAACGDRRARRVTTRPTCASTSSCATAAAAERGQAPSATLSSSLTDEMPRRRGTRANVAAATDERSTSDSSAGHGSLRVGDAKKRDELRAEHRDDELVAPRTTTRARPAPRTRAAALRDPRAAARAARRARGRRRGPRERRDVLLGDRRSVQRSPTAIAPSADDARRQRPRRLMPRYRPRQAAGRRGRRSRPRPRVRSRTRRAPRNPRRASRRASRWLRSAPRHTRGGTGCPPCRAAPGTRRPAAAPCGTTRVEVIAS